MKLNMFSVFLVSAFALSSTKLVQAESVASVASAEVSESLIYTCEQYSEYSQEQVKDSMRYGCDFGGIHWSVDSVDHKNWCLSTKNEQLITDQQHRKDKQLEACKEMRTSPLSPSNQLKVPESCKDPTKAYTPVRHVNWSDYVSDRPVSPVQNGLIEYDFNTDERLDFVFLEAKESREIRAQFIICMSQKGNYTRHLTDISIYSMPGLSFLGVKVRSNEGLLNMTILYYERAYGKAQQKVIYEFSKDTGKFIVVDSHGTAYNVTTREDAYQMTPPKIPKLF